MEYRRALKALEGFSHIQVIWWLNGCDNAQDRAILEVDQPYKNAPETVGIFSTSSPARPNPLGLTVSEVIHMDPKDGFIWIAYTDADDGSPVLDVKPYTPSMDRVENPSVPAWCGNWPKSLEDSEDFPWEEIFNF